MSYQSADKQLLSQWYSETQNRDETFDYIKQWATQILNSKRPQLQVGPVSHRTKEKQMGEK